MAKQQTGQTGQREFHFEVAKGEDGLWHWLLKSGNGRYMAMDVEGYPRRNDCTRAIKYFHEAVQGKLPRVFIAHDETLEVGEHVEPPASQPSLIPEEEAAEE